MANQPKKYKKFVATAATATLVASAIVPVASAKSFNDVADNNDHKANIDKISDLGYMGTGDNFNPGGNLTRGQVAIILANWAKDAAGKTVPADYKTAQRFEDVALTADDKLLQSAALVFDNEIFSGSNGNLLPANEITRLQMALVLNKAYGAVTGKTLVELAGDTSDVVIGDLDQIPAEHQGVVKALKKLGITAPANFNPNGKVTRAQFASFFISTIEAKAPVTEVVVESVTAINLKQVAVTFNGKVDAEKAKTLGNYAVYNQGATTNLVTSGSVELQEDGKTVIITLGTALNNAQTAKAVVKNVTTETTKEFSVSDSTVPTVKGVSVVGPRTFEVEFSEPVTNVDESDFTVDEGNYIVTDATANTVGNVVTVTVGVDLTEEKHNVKVTGASLTDYAGYKALPRTIEFNVAKDTTLPTASIKSVSPTEVVVVFDKPVSNVADANVLFSHTYNASTYQYDGADTLADGTTPFVTQVSSTEYKLNFSDKPIPLGTNKIYIGYSNENGTKITDGWGNKLASVALDVNVTLDQVKPSVSKVEFVNAAQLTVTFNETLDETSAETASNYVIKDAAGDVIPTRTATLGGTNNNVVTLDFDVDALGGGNYTIEIKGVKDVALVKNIMDTYTSALSFADTIKPTVLASKYAIDNTGTTKKATAYVPFSEQMDTAKLVKSNFEVKINSDAYRPLNSDEKLTVAADGKSVTIVVENGSTNITNLEIKVGAVTDKAGNGIQGFIADSAAGGFTLTEDAIAVKSIKAVGTKQLKVTYDGRLSSVTAAGYSLVKKADGTPSGIALSVASHTVNKDGESEVIFNLGASLAADATLAGDDLQLVANSATGTKSFLGTVLTNVAHSTAPVATADLQDEIKPTLADVEVDSATQITLTFTEALEADTFAATLNGFSVSGGTLASVAITGNDDATTVVLTGTGFNSSTTVTYNEVAGIEDVAGNKLTGFTNQK